MKVNSTLTSGLLLSVKNILLMLVMLFCGLTVYSQTPSVVEQIGDISTNKWKSAADLNLSLAGEDAKMVLLLNNPSLIEPEKALFKAYQRLLGYIQSDLQTGKPVDQAIIGSYEKVLVDAVVDPELKNMPEGLLLSYIPGLIETLNEVPVPVPVNK